jgi:hypothetical protein
VRVDLRYQGTSGLREGALRFAPNLARPPVFLDAALAQPVRFREAMSALHDVVIGDLKFRRRDRSDHEAWKKRQAEEEIEARRLAYEQAKAFELSRLSDEPIPPDLDGEFQRMHGLYWNARRRWASELSANDPALFRALVPCDPVVTVAPDVVFFECFSKDESSYGCLSLDRDALRGAGDAGLGTTNVDYSLPLYEHFQGLRSYRPTRLLVDPSGFEVRVAGRGEIREEKIDLPASWLRGFGNLSAAMGLPARRVELPVEVVYALLTYLVRHREKGGPRSLRFRLEPGRAPVLTLDPWGVQIASRGAAYAGERAEEIKVWGRRRLLVLARLLPIAESIEVHLLGSGMPSLWIVRAGELRFTLGLSGWTANDWAGGASIDALAGTYRTQARAEGQLAAHLHEVRRATVAELRRAVDVPEDVLLGGLVQLARRGQAVYDPGAGVFRWRPILAVPLAEEVLGPESPELVAARALYAEGAVSVAREELLPGGRRLLVGKVRGTSVEGMLDTDLRFSRARCTCSLFHKAGLRGGPCRHLLALHMHARHLPADGGAPKPGWN